MSSIILREILVIHLLLKVKPFACGLNCLLSFPHLKNFFKLFIFLKDAMSFITFSGFLKWVFKHKKATKP